MFQAIIELSNGEILTVSDEELIFPIIKLVDEKDIFTSKAPTFVLWSHTHDGLIPCITEMLMKYDFFQLESDSNKVYKSSAVVSIKNL